MQAFKKAPQARLRTTGEDLIWGKMNLAQNPNLTKHLFPD
jgi:hypothetical protein